MKDYRTWWRIGRHVTFHMEGGIAKLKYEVIDLSERDEKLEQIWAIREGLA